MEFEHKGYTGKIEDGRGIVYDEYGKFIRIFPTYYGFIVKDSGRIVSVWERNLEEFQKTVDEYIKFCEEKENKLNVDSDNTKLLSYFGCMVEEKEINVNESSSNMKKYQYHEYICCSIWDKWDKFTEAWIEYEDEKIHYLGPNFNDENELLNWFHKKVDTLMENNECPGEKETEYYKGYFCEILSIKNCSYNGNVLDQNFNHISYITHDNYDRVIDIFHKIIDEIEQEKKNEESKQKKLDLRWVGWNDKEHYNGYNYNMWYDDEGDFCAELFDENGEESGFVEAKSRQELTKKIKKDIDKLTTWRKEEQVTSTFTWAGNIGRGQGKWINGRPIETCEYKNFDIPDFLFNDNEDTENE